MSKPAVTVKFKTYIKLVCSFLRSTFLHNEYCYNIEWMEKDCEDDGGDDSWVIAAKIAIDHVYLNFTLCVYPTLQESFENGNLCRVAEALIHEFSHLLTQPIYYEATVDAAPSQLSNLKDLNERQTQRVANVISNTLPKNWYKPDTLAKLVLKVST